MELLLNLAWLSVTLLCAVGLLCRGQREPESRRLWLLVTAMVCVVVLLFPVISITDDLHAEVFTTEESGKRKVVSIEAQHQLATVQFFVARFISPLMVARRTPLPAGNQQLVPLVGVRTAWVTRPPPANLFA